MLEEPTDNEIVSILQGCLWKARGEPRLRVYEFGNEESHFNLTLKALADIIG